MGKRKKIFSRKKNSYDYNYILKKFYFTSYGEAAFLFEENELIKIKNVARCINKKVSKFFPMLNEKIHAFKDNNSLIIKFKEVLTAQEKISLIEDLKIVMSSGIEPNLVARLGGEYFSEKALPEKKKPRIQIDYNEVLKDFYFNPDGNATFQVEEIDKISGYAETINRKISNFFPILDEKIRAHTVGDNLIIKFQENLSNQEKISLIDDLKAAMLPRKKNEKSALTNKDVEEKVENESGCQHNEWLTNIESNLVANNAVQDENEFDILFSSQKTLTCPMTEIVSNSSDANIILSPAVLDCQENDWSNDIDFNLVENNTIPFFNEHNNALSFHQDNFPIQEIPTYTVTKLVSHLPFSSLLPDQVAMQAMYIPAICNSSATLFNSNGSNELNSILEPVTWISEPLTDQSIPATCQRYPQTILEADMEPDRYVSQNNLLDNIDSNYFRNSSEQSLDEASGKKIKSPNFDYNKILQAFYFDLHGKAIFPNGKDNNIVKIGKYAYHINRIISKYLPMLKDNIHAHCYKNNLGISFKELLTEQEKIRIITDIKTTISTTKKNTSPITKRNTSPITKRNKSPIAKKNTSNGFNFIEYSAEQSLASGKKMGSHKSIKPLSMSTSSKENYQKIIQNSLQTEIHASHNELLNSIASYGFARPVIHASPFIHQASTHVVTDVISNSLDLNIIENPTLQSPFSCMNTLSSSQEILLNTVTEMVSDLTSFSLPLNETATQAVHIPTISNSRATLFSSHGTSKFNSSLELVTRPRFNNN